MPEAKGDASSADRGRSVADRVFIVLEALADASTPPTLSELAELTALPMPTLHRLLRFLTTNGYVRQEPSKRYIIGLGMIRFGQSASRGLDSWAAPHLAGLVEKYGETTNMAMLEGDSVVYVAQAPSPRAMRMFTEIGHVVMPHCTGVGKAILSMLTDQQVTSLLGRTGMPVRTDHTLTTNDAVLAALGEARQRGYTLDYGEQEAGVRCVAVPLTGLPFLAAISVSGPSSRIMMDDVYRIAPDLQEVADDISRKYRSDVTGNLLQPNVRHAS